MSAVSGFASLSFAKPLVMGIVNVTPDSFSDGGDHLAAEAAIAHGRRLIAEGADLLDIGGESTRPGAAPVTETEEIERIVPVIRGLAGLVPLSLDTRHAAVMRAGVAAGADIINDVTALTDGPESMATAAELGKPVILMHMQGKPQTMQLNPIYDDVVEDVYSYLAERIEACTKAGVKLADIAIDPGFGFGKTLAQNLALLNNLPRLAQLGCPILIGTSRKSSIEKIMGVPTAPKDRLPGSLATLVPAFEAGAAFYRVHDVAPTQQFLTVLRALREAA